MKVDLSKYRNKEFQPGSFLKRGTWYFINLIFFNSGFFPFYWLKTFLLKLFGSTIGKNIFIKTNKNLQHLITKL